MNSSLTPDVLYFAVLGVLLAFLAWEWRRHPERYDLGDTLNNVAMYVGYLVIGGFWTVVLLHLYGLVWQHRLFNLGPYWLDPSHPYFWAEWGALLVLEDFCFYWFHRSSHRYGLFWASHVTHHSSTHFNFSTALRQSWIPFHTFVFWLPLPLLGFDPLMVISQQLLSLGYQAFLHTTASPWPRALEFLLNTPTHHRVHHASNRAVVDRNFGGVLILWDRAFSTFSRAEDAGEPIRFGVEPPVRSTNLLRLELQGWTDYLRRLWTRIRVGPSRVPARPGE